MQDLDQRFGVAEQAELPIDLGQCDDHAHRLRDALAWIDAEAEARSIELVVVLGDVGWNGGAAIARGILDTSSVPYVPINGDNEIQADSEEDYQFAFETHYQSLEQQLDDWRKAPVPVFDTVNNVDSYLQNFSFNHKGVRFIGLDWSSRLLDPLYGEMAHLHDFDGGTFRWLADELAAYEGAEESVVMLTHEPMVMMPGGFNATDWDQVSAIIEPHGGQVYANLSGHLHLNAEVEALDAGIDVFVVDATWDDSVTVRLVSVWGDGQRMTYEHEVVVVP